LRGTRRKTIPPSNATPTAPNTGRNQDGRLAALPRDARIPPDLARAPPDKLRRCGETDWATGSSAFSPSTLESVFLRFGDTDFVSTLDDGTAELVAWVALVAVGLRDPGRSRSSSDTVPTAGWAGRLGMEEPVGDGWEGVAGAGELGIDAGASGGRTAEDETSFCTTGPTFLWAPIAASGLDLAPSDVPGAGVEAVVRTSWLAAVPARPTEGSVAGVGVAGVGVAGVGVAGELATAD
jgi:hypothetical protein